MASRTSPPTRAPSTLIPALAKLDDHIVGDTTFASAYLRALGAIACADGAVTLPEFAAITDIARQSENPALASVMLIYSADRPLPLDEAMSALSRAATDQLVSVRQAAFEAARPLLALQGGNSRTLATQLATALSIRPATHELDAFEGEVPQGLLDNLGRKLGRRARQLIQGRSIVDVAEEFRRTAGDADIATQIRAYEQGDIDRTTLQRKLIDASETFRLDIDAYRTQLAQLQDISSTAATLSENSERYIKQVAQRLAVVEARIHFERRAFAEDIDEAVHDAGNAVELQIAQRLKRDDWTEKSVWQDIGRDEFARTLERRVDRLVRRREEILALFKDDLRLFQEEMRFVRTALATPQHHAALAGFMPALRLRTRIANSADLVASVAIGTSTLGALGTGAATYLLGAAVVWPVVAPVIPIVGGAVVVATAFKLLTDADKRKSAEISSKRTAFEKAMRAKLQEADASFNRQLDDIGTGFRITAEQLLRPLTLEAEAALRLADIQSATAERLVTESSRKIRQLPAELEQVATD